MIDILIFIAVVLLKVKINKIFRSDSMDIEKVLVELRANQDAAEKEIVAMHARIKILENALPKDIRRVGLVRYNPFSDAGGDQSFALALLNEDKDGVVISSLYGRELNRVYAKQIEKGSSKYQLTEEEKTAIQNAQ